MKREIFDKIVEERITAIRSTLSCKGIEYQRNADVLHNFERAAILSGNSREKALWGFALKHYISFLDILDDVEQNNLPPLAVLEEKINDLICYLILEEASIKDKIGVNKQNLPF